MVLVLAETSVTLICRFRDIAHSVQTNAGIMCLDTQVLFSSL
jgi:hypothetical protein